MRYLFAALLVVFAAPCFAAPPPPAGFKITIDACEKADVVMTVDGKTIKCGETYVIRGYRDDYVTLKVTHTRNGRLITEEFIIGLEAGYILGYTLSLREPIDLSKWC